MYDRQMDIFDPEIHPAHVMLIGCGGIGSPTALVLAKMGIQSIECVDFDLVERINRPSTFYREIDEGKKKVDALAEILHQFVGEEVKISSIDGKAEESKLEYGGIVISGVDSMQARKKIWKEVKKKNRDVMIFVDARMAGEFCYVFSVDPKNPEHVEFFESTLFGDQDADPERCTAKAIIYNTTMIASLIARQIKGALNGEVVYRAISMDLMSMSLEKDGKFILGG